MPEKPQGNGTAPSDSLSIKSGCNDAPSPITEPPLLQIEELSKELEAKSKKIEKLQKYIANLEADGDRLNDKLVIANSFRDCFALANSPLMMTDENLAITFANKAFYEMTDTTPEILTRKTMCGELLRCQLFRKECLLKRCFESGKMIPASHCNLETPSQRRFHMVVDAFPIKNIASNRLIGGIEFYREVFEDTRRKYIMFVLCGDDYGMEAEKLKEIIRMTTIVPVQGVPDYVEGVINLRGEVIPVVNLQKRLGLMTKEHPITIYPIILICMLLSSKQHVGILVDEVREVVTLDINNMEKCVDWGYLSTPELIQGVAKLKDEVQILINVDKLLDE